MCLLSTVFLLSLPPLPPPDLECLFWGLYFNSTSVASSKNGLHLLTEKWSRTLCELDITNHAFSEEDLEIAMGHLALGEGAEALRSLNLTGTKLTSQALRYSRATGRRSLGSSAFCYCSTKKISQWNKMAGRKHSGYCG